jgi:hypothetical protein
MLVVAVSGDELTDVESEHLARLSNSSGDFLGHAVVKLVHRSATGSAIVLQPTERLSGTVAVEIDMTSRWPFALPRRGRDIPRNRAAVALSPKKVETKTPGGNVFAIARAPNRPVRTPAPPAPKMMLRLANDRHPDRLPLTAHQVSHLDWLDWQLATAVVAEKAVHHRWSTSLRLLSQSASIQPFHVIAPVGGSFTIADNLQVGGTLLPGQLVGTITVDDHLAKEVCDADKAFGDERHLRLQRLFRRGINAELIADLLGSEHQREIAVFAPTLCIVETHLKDARVADGQSLMTVNVPAYTIAYGCLTGAEPLPVRVDLSLRIGVSHFAQKALPLVERSNTRRTFAIPLPIVASSPRGEAHLVDHRSVGQAAALPKDCVMLVARSTEVLLHSGNRQLTRKPVHVLYEDDEYAYVDLEELPEGVEAVRDVAVLAAHFPRIAAVMAGFIMPK